MVEDVLKKCKYKSVKMSELKKLLPKQVMHPTLKIVLDYLWESGKIEYTPDGIRWIFIHPDQRKKLLSGFMEVIK
ncbi:hypothetical protein DRJ17_03835 [Candidatus Woesearchaeota archaeon]|nr:MAG: hypothetical protein DRJ17_03835 [Candidatus Woesearchaeota archaeon]